MSCSIACLTCLFLLATSPVTQATPRQTGGDVTETPTATRWREAWTVGRSGAAGLSEIEALLNLSADEDPELRWVATDALLRISEQLAQEPLRERIADRMLGLARDPASDVRWAAVRGLGQYGIDRDDRLEALCERAAADDAAVRRAALTGLGRTAPRLAQQAATRLIAWLDDDDAGIATEAMRALGQLGPLTDTVAQALARVIVHGSRVRRLAATDALAEATFAGPESVRFLADGLASDDLAVTRAATRALGGARGGAAIQALTDALAADDPTLFRLTLENLQAVVARTELAGALSPTELATVRQRIAARAASEPTIAAELLERLVAPDPSPHDESASNPPEPQPAQQAARIPPKRLAGSSRARLSPATEQQPDPTSLAVPSAPLRATPAAPRRPRNVPDRARPLPRQRATPSNSTPEHESSADSAWSILWLLAAFLCALPYGLVLATYLTRPADLWILARRLDDWTVRRLGPAAIRFSPARWWAVEALAGRARAVDAWITERAPRARHAMASRPTVRARTVRVPTPIVLSGRLLEHPRIQDLRQALAASPNGLRLFGEGGSGKTTLAFRLALAALADDENERLFFERRLPIVFESSEALPHEALPEAWYTRFRAELETALDERLTANEVRRLARSGRLLIVLDGLSELDEATRRVATSVHTACPHVVAVGTARAPADFGPLFGAQVALVRIDGSDLARFLDRYLVASGVRHTLDDATFFDGLGQLSRLTDAGDVTPLVASLFVDAWLAARDDDAPMPRTLGELLDLRLTRAILRHASDARVVRDAMAAASAVLGPHRRPGSIPTERLRGALRELESGSVESRIETLLEVGLLERAGRAGLRFALDPMAEHLAARAEIERLCGLDAWTRLIGDTDQLPNAPESVAGWLRALRDEAGARAEANDPAAIAALPELEERLQRARTGTTRELERSRFVPSRASAQLFPPARELGSASTLAELLRCLSGPDPLLRARAADLLAERGPEASAAVDALARSVGTHSATGLGALARAAAAAALGRMGPTAAAALPELQRAARDPNELVRVEASRAIAQLRASASDELVRPSANRDGARGPVRFDPPSGLGQVHGRANVTRNES